MGGVNEKEVENYGDPLLRKFNPTKQKSLPLHRCFRSKREKKHSRIVTRARSNDTYKLEVSKSILDKIDVENEQKLVETDEGWKKSSDKSKEKNCWFFLHSNCKFGPHCKKKNMM